MLVRHIREYEWVERIVRTCIFPDICSLHDLLQLLLVLLAEHLRLHLDAVFWKQCFFTHLGFCLLQCRAAHSRGALAAELVAPPVIFLMGFAAIGHVLTLTADQTSSTSIKKQVSSYWLQLRKILAITNNSYPQSAQVGARGAVPALDGASTAGSKQ